MNLAAGCAIAQHLIAFLPSWTKTTMREPILAWPDDIDGRQVTFGAIVQVAAYLLHWMTAGQQTELLQSPKLPITIGCLARLSARRFAEYAQWGRARSIFSAFAAFR